MNNHLNLSQCLHIVKLIQRTNKNFHEQPFYYVSTVGETYQITPIIIDNKIVAINDIQWAEFLVIEYTYFRKVCNMYPHHVVKYVGE